MAAYAHFRRVSGWTPEQVRSLTLDELYWLPIEDEAHDIAQAQVSRIDSD
jgi:hypothetical protein